MGSGCGSRLKPGERDEVPEEHAEGVPLGSRPGGHGAGAGAGRDRLRMAGVLAEWVQTAKVEGDGDVAADWRWGGPPGERGRLGTRTACSPAANLLGTP